MNIKQRNKKIVIYTTVSNEKFLEIANLLTEESAVPEWFNQLESKYSKAIVRAHGTHHAKQTKENGRNTHDTFLAKLSKNSWSICEG